MKDAFSLITKSTAQRDWAGSRERYLFQEPRALYGASFQPQSENSTTHGWNQLGSILIVRTGKPGIAGEKNLRIKLK